MSRALFSCAGGTLALPDRSLVLVDRADGGNLIVNPPTDVWERSELTPDELGAWSVLVAASGRAMLDALPQLAGGCINYWEAGNWALNDGAVPAGPKDPREHRRVHLHLLGRSRSARHPSWRWGEAPVFPAFADRHVWAASFSRLRADECWHITRRLEELLTERYSVSWIRQPASRPCAGCGYPTPAGAPNPTMMCGECSESVP